MKYIVTLNGNKYEVEVDGTNAILNPEDSSPENVPVQTQVMVSAVSQKQSSQPDTQLPEIGDGIPVKTPLPGNVVEIYVSTGDEVNADDTVALVEAMKMENEIKAGIKGTITSVVATKGSSVKTDGILVTIK